MIRKATRKIFLENLLLKIIALLLALAMFLYVRLEQQQKAVTGALVKTTFIPPAQFLARMKSTLMMTPNRVAVFTLKVT